MPTGYLHQTWFFIIWCDKTVIQDVQTTVRGAGFILTNMFMVIIIQGVSGT